MDQLTEYCWLRCRERYSPYSETFGRITLLICLILGLKGKMFKKKIHI